MIQVGADAPDFSLPFEPGPARVTLSELEGEPVVLMFVPLAFSSTCTAELCGVRDDWSAWEGLRATVLGISVDSPFVTRKWAEEMEVPFRILSDFNREAASAYGVLYDDFYGLHGVAKRAVFVIDRAGKVRYAWMDENADILPPFDEVKKAVQAVV